MINTSLVPLRKITPTSQRSAEVWNMTFYGHSSVFRSVEEVRRSVGEASSGA